LDHLTQRLLMKRCRRMIHRNDDRPVLSSRLPVDLADRVSREVPLHRMTPERHDHFRLYDLDLLLEILPARFDFVSLWIAVVRWPVLHDVRDEHLLAVEPDRSQQLVEELSGGADKRPALLVLVELGPFADEHDVR